MKLYNFFRSSTSHRLRIALNLKGLDYDYVAVCLPKGEHLSAAFKALNPQGFVPALEVDGQVLSQSPAIIEWLEERFPTPALLPAGAEARARVRAMAAVVGCDIHPLHNRRVLDYLRRSLRCEDEAVSAWCREWIGAGLTTLEAMLAAAPRGRYCWDDAPGLADVYVVPAMESARRFGLDLSPYPRLRAIDAACAELEAFRRAVPSAQPDAA